MGCRLRSFFLSTTVPEASGKADRPVVQFSLSLYIYMYLCVLFISEGILCWQQRGDAMSGLPGTDSSLQWVELSQRALHMYGSAHPTWPTRAPPHKKKRCKTK